MSGSEGVVTGGNSRILGQNLLESMGVDKNLKWTGYQAQHIIPSQLKSHPVLQKVGINLDEASNGIFLRIPDEGISPMARHRGFHSVYNQVVKNRLDSIDTNSSGHPR
ncbi:AHH domain-containing protein [Microbulbifer sp. SSSA002]|uniref:AHH domain-containing protein n=1 Tax=Microbulbifer sp. SSSA002 TaxID=3243376 RepID=UPI00403A25C7